MPAHGILVATERAQIDDSRSPWTLGTLKISELYQILNKSSIPSDFNLRNASITPSSDPLIRLTYEWVRDNIDPQNSMHQLAFIIAAIISKLAPNLFFNPPNAALCLDQISTTAVIRQSPWISTTSTRKGGKDPKPFLTMVPVHIIAIMESKSPLRLNMVQSNMNGFGSKWTSKHGVYPFIHPPNHKLYNIFELQVTKE